MYLFFNIRLLTDLDIHLFKLLDSFMNLSSFVIYFVIFTIQIQTLKLHLLLLEDFKEATFQDHVETSVSLRLKFEVQFMYMINITNLSSSCSLYMYIKIFICKINVNVCLLITKFCIVYIVKYLYRNVSSYFKLIVVIWLR